MRTDIQFLAKYDKAGPRYTSYPTAPHFNENFNQNMLIEEIKRTHQMNRTKPLSLYFHLPFCEKLCFFCGCNMMVTRNFDRIDRYIEYLIKEMNLLRPLIDEQRKVHQLHWGGGTPTYLRPDQISRLMQHIFQQFQFDENSENSCEADPRGLTYEHLKTLLDHQFNRVSIGVQDMNPVVQQAINRIQPKEMIFQVVQWIRDLNFKSLNIDLMYGLPFQTEQSFMETLEYILTLSPDRLAIFNYAHVPWLKKHMQVIREETLPSPDEKLKILSKTIDRLQNAGYIYIGMDHFAKPNDPLVQALNNKSLYRNFQGYSTHKDADLYAFGISSISQISRIYSQNYKTEKEYFQSLDQLILPIYKGYRLTDDDVVRREVIMGLMCDYEINMTTIEEKYLINFKQYFAYSLKQLHHFILDGLVELKNEKIIITSAGKLLVRNIAMCFDWFIEQQKDQTRYSRTV